MELRTELDQRQVLTGKMIESVQMLQMNGQELKELMAEILLENPVAELVETEPEPTQEEDIRRKLEWLEEINADNRIYYHQEDDSQDKWTELGNTEAAENLEEFLTAQLFGKDLTPRQERIIGYMVQNLDSKGYLEVPLTEIMTVLKVPGPEAEAALLVLQSLEPPGVGAQNLKECLMLQLRRKPEPDQIAEAIVNEYLEELGKNQIPLIAKRLGITTGAVNAAAETIRALNPKPGNGFHDREMLGYITPDITVVKLKDYYEILINDYLYPNIRINRDYKKMLVGQADAEVEKYIASKIEQIEWVKGCIDKRNSTLLELCKLIVHQQLDFFESGQGKKPFLMKEAAEILGVHESTVSRAVKGKYLQCLWGLYPLSFFFSKSLEQAGGTLATPDDIRQIIIGIIEKEDKSRPLSDQKIVQELKQLGYTISRRTVAKYRGILNIKGASGRKSY